MLGIFRYVLALGVVAGHLWSAEFLFAGFYAVFCFYLVSGYLMSLVLNQVYTKYEDAPKYLANRALRIFPPYLATLALTAVAVALFPEGMTEPIFVTTHPPTA